MAAVVPPLQGSDFNVVWNPGLRSSDSLLPGLSPHAPVGLSKGRAFGAYNPIIPALSFRNAAVFIKGTRHTPPNAARVSEELDHLVDWLGTSTLPPVLLAAETHFRFEALHPFFDGNGRTGRLLLNWQLLRAGFPMTVIQLEERAQYLDALDQGHTGALLPLQTLVATAVERSLDLASS